VKVDDNQYVKAGTVLLELDPKDYEVALASARATLANDKAGAAAIQTGVPLTSASTSSQLSGAQADVEKRRGRAERGSAASGGGASLTPAGASQRP